MSDKAFNSFYNSVQAILNPQKTENKIRSELEKEYKERHKKCQKQLEETQAALEKTRESLAYSQAALQSVSLLVSRSGDEAIALMKNTNSILLEYSQETPKK